MQHDDDHDDTTSRSDEKRARRVREDALSRLAANLADLADRQLEQLELPEAVLDALHELRRIRSLPARARQLRVVRSTLRDGDWPAIRSRVEQLRARGSVSPGHDARAHEWLVRLIGEGHKAIDALVAEHPSADRKHIAQLVRNAASGSEPRRRRAEQKLIQTLRWLLGSG